MWAGLGPPPCTVAHWFHDNREPELLCTQFAVHPFTQWLRAAQLDGNDGVLILSLKPPHFLTGLRFNGQYVGLRVVIFELEQEMDMGQH